MTRSFFRAFVFCSIVVEKFETQFVLFSWEENMNKV